MRADELMRATIKILTDGAELESGSAATHVERALDKLMDLQQVVQETPQSPEDFAYFKKQVVQLLKTDQNGHGLTMYVFHCFNYAGRGRLDGFEEACHRRSAVQLLNDEYAPWSELFIPDDLEVIEEIDELLEEASDDAPPVPEPGIPGWVPDTHWWWRAPKRQDMTEEERAERIDYDSNDGL
ncbi:hypothetical protein [Marinitenerispora sediminis]|nr:hypothetical protein [Marinitenerispora sediminis]RCV49120.1 hypothetical protein DEF28_21720 [Marinitenerispora sediminis]RCV51845.1 hypothetical protein DEF23_19775 [Marinitenerispora sediminis]